MNIVQINACVNESTGTIMMELRKHLQESGENVMTSSRFDYSKREVDYPAHVYIGNLMDKYTHRFLATISGKEGGFSRKATKIFLQKITDFHPDIIHLHNLHSNYINLEMLFDYLKMHDDIKVIWTLHDCWAFTGHCPYYDIIGCEKWKKQCGECSVYKSYPKSFFDNSSFMYKKKKSMFVGIPGLTLVTPSKWLSEQVKDSFLAEYPLRIINNVIDIDIFKKSEDSVEFRRKYQIGNKHIILGVASNWGGRKGLNTMNRLAECLPENVQVVLVGQLGETWVSEKIITIERTESKMQLAQIYSAADLFINPTEEENYPTVNMEAIACGTPVITYITGGAFEVLDGKCGFGVKKGDFNGLMNAVFSSLDKQWNEEEFEERREYFSNKRMVNEYLALYYANKS